MIAAAVVAEIEAAAILTLKEKAAENRGAQPALKPKGKTGKAKRKASPALVFLTKEDKAPAKDVSKAPVALLPENSLGKKYVEQCADAVLTYPPVLAFLTSYVHFSLQGQDD